MISRAVNLIIVLVTLIILILFFRKDGKWDTGKAKRAFRYFTVLSNTFCAISALLMCISPENELFWMLKYIGTVAVTVTMLTVFIFLMPVYRTFTGLLKGYDLFMHLLTPLMAAVSLCVFERRPISVLTAASGVIPVFVYGVWYLYHVICAPEEKRWEDFYRFNMGGRWPISFVSMITASFLICLGYWALLRQPF